MIKLKTGSKNFTFESFFHSVNEIKIFFLIIIRDINVHNTVMGMFYYLHNQQTLFVKLKS